MKSPLVDVAAILMCAALIVLIGQYYIAKKDRETSLQQIEQPVESRTQKMIPPVVDWSKFEVASKRTE